MKEWSKPGLLEDELPAVKAFRDDLLPNSLRAFAKDVAHRMQASMDFVAVALIVALAGAVNRRAVVQPKANDTSWVVIPNLWGGLVGFPSTMKSPVITAMMRPLSNIENQLLAEYNDAVQEYEAAIKAYAKDKRGEKPEQPIPTRLIVNDATPEMLHALMSHNPAGLLLIRDELTGMLAEFEKRGREGERAFYLTAWNGDSSYTVDRLGRGTIHVPACCLSVLGGIQPAPLRAHLSGSRGVALQSDGLIQRFSLLVWPDKFAWTYVDQEPDDEAQQQVEDVFKHLTALDPKARLEFRFSPKAQELFVLWFEDLQYRIDFEDGSPVIASHLMKYRKLMPALALLFELADMVAEEGFDGFEGLKGEQDISFRHAAQAVEWCEYLESHARRVYSCVGTPEQQSAKLLAERLKKRDIGDGGYFTLREVMQKDWHGLKNSKVVTGAITILENAGWVRDVSQKPGPQGGRPSIRYEVNPRIWE